MCKVKILDSAADEAAEAAAWYELQHAGLGADFEHAVDAVLDDGYSAAILPGKPHG